MKCNVKKCKAACCGAAPITKVLYEKHKHLIKSVDYSIIEISKYHIIAMTDDISCCFLDTKYKCIIYDERPEICRRFGESNERNPLLKCSYKEESNSKEMAKELIR